MRALFYCLLGRCVFACLTAGLGFHGFGGSVRFRLPYGRFGVSRNTLTLFREIKSAIRSVLGTLCGAVRFCPYLSAFLWYRRFNFRTCGSWGRFVLSVRLLFAPSVQRGLCPHALRAPLPKGSSPLGILASLARLDPLSVLQCASFFFCACGHFALSLFVLCGFGRSAFRSRNRVRINAAKPLLQFRIPHSEFRIDKKAPQTSRLRHSL